MTLKYLTLNIVAAAACATLGCDVAFSAGVAALTSADYARAEQFAPYNMRQLVHHAIEASLWSSSDGLVYRLRESAGVTFVSVDPRSGRQRSFLDGKRLLSTLSVLSGRHFEASDIPDDSLALSSDGGTLTFTNTDGRWSCTARAYACRLDALPEGGVTSPDGRRVAFRRDFNLWVRDLAEGNDVQMTSDGERDFGYATDNPGWGPTNRAILTWSPDSRRIATYKADQRALANMYLVRTRPGHPQLEAWKYSMPGDPVTTTIQRLIVDVPKRRVIALQSAPDPYRQSAGLSLDQGDGTMADVQWSADSRTLAYVSVSRDFKRAELKVADAESGAIRTVLTEDSPTYFRSTLATFEGGGNWRYLPEQRLVLWFSTRSGWGHLYLYDLPSGHLLRAVTSGSWNVLKVLKLDPKRREIYLLGVGREATENPYYQNLYRVNYATGALQRLTPEHATHTVSLSPSGAYFLDSYSTPGMPPTAVLRTRAGRTLEVLERADISELTAMGWQPPTPIVVKARNGTTDLYGLLFAPTHLVETQKYPLIDWIYPGPQVGSVDDWRFPTDGGGWNVGSPRELAELGFGVVLINGMGTPFRSAAFAAVSYGNLGDNTLPDQVAAISQLEKDYRWIDPEHVGVFGQSGGGYAAAAAMLRYPSLFKVGVSISGDHDPRGFTDQWGDRYQGILVTRSDGSTNYESAANESLAVNLTGHLLLVHGTLDDHVPPYETLQFVDALIKANRNFDLLMVPNQRHDYVGSARGYVTRRTWDYFVRYLKGAVPPEEYAFHIPEGE